jgi:hypothetical protein
MDTSGVFKKKYRRDYNILKTTGNVKMVQEVTVSCTKGVWHKIWPSIENYSTKCDNLDMPIQEISEIAEAVGVDNADPMGITKF